MKTGRWPMPTQEQKANGWVVNTQFLIDVKFVLRETSADLETIEEIILAAEYIRSGGTKFPNTFEYKLP